MVLIVLVVSGAVYLWVNREAATDRGVLVSYGFTEPFNGKAEVHVEFTDVMVKSDPPPGWPEGAIDWPAWASRHFELLDSSGQPVTVGHVDTSPVAGDHRGGEAVGFAKGEVGVGQSYTVFYIPVASQPKRYSLKFTVPSSKTVARQVYFLPPNAG
jgi:hypothetical protein